MARFARVVHPGFPYHVTYRGNRREGWCGHLWANRFFSTPLDSSHLWAGVKYVDLNPVRVRIVPRAERNA